MENRNPNIRMLARVLNNLMVNRIMADREDDVAVQIEFRVRVTVAKMLGIDAIDLGLALNDLDDKGLQMKEDGGIDHEADAEFVLKRVKHWKTL